MTQEQRIMQRLQKGPITQMEAINELGVMRLASRISALKQKGEPIKKRMITVRNRYGEKCSICEYSLPGCGDDRLF